MKNIAIISPNQNAYSETFIQAHRDLLKGNIHFLYGGSVPQYFGDNQCILDFYVNKKWEEYLQENKLSRKILRLLPYTIYQKYFKNQLFQSAQYTIVDAICFYLKYYKIDVILAEYGPTGAAILPIAKKLNIKLIVHFHGYDASINALVEQYKDKYLEMFEYASNIIAVSKVMRVKLLSLGCPEYKIIVNPCGPNDSFLNMVPKFNKIQFCSIGRFVDKKAPYYTILAFKKVLNKYPDANLVMAGDGPLLNTCKNIVKFLNIDHNVEFPGVITPQQFKTYLEESLAYVQHSITAENGDMEGTPVAILEASAAGLPVISTKHAGIPDVIIDGKTGYLVDEHDVQAMADKIIAIVENIEFAKKIGTMGKQNIKSAFTLDDHIKKIQNIL
jgi:colanic acid/amylovoran biosynthesis glycosyltransferase